MIKQSRFVVLFKDSPKDPPKYFGPFASQTLAENFRDELPAPNKGGGAVVRPLEMYGFEELPLIKSIIERERKTRH